MEPVVAEKQSEVRANDTNAVVNEEIADLGAELQIRATLLHEAIPSFGLRDVVRLISARVQGQTVKCLDLND